MSFSSSTAADLLSHCPRFDFSCLFGQVALSLRMALPSRPDELESFKSQINLCAYAAARGFELDRRQSSRCSAVMRHANGEKIVVARGSNGHWTYFSVTSGNTRDCGTIIDFVQVRDRTTLGEVRKELRPWIGQGSLPPAASRPAFRELVPSEHDAARVTSAWMKARPIDGSHDYLEVKRRIPRHVLADPIFADRIRTDARRNALFPHWNSEGLCGFELKSEGFTGFSPGGVKSLWSSRSRRGDRELVICESPIDALSYATLFGTDGKRFVSTAGQISPAQAQHLRSAVMKMPDGSGIVLAFDNDPGGRDLVTSITAVLREIDLESKELVRRLPNDEDYDWNDVLRRSVASSDPEPA